MPRHPILRQVYVVGAVLAFVGTFPPLFADDDPESTYATSNLWASIGLDGGEFAVIGVVLVLAMVAAAVTAALGVRRSYGAPTVVLVLAAIGTLMLVFKPGTGASPPSLGAGAGLLLGAAIVLLVTALADVLDLVAPEGERERPPIQV